MSDLIRGGQVTFHKFRMLMQVNKVLWRLAVILVITSIGYSYYKNISPKEWEVGFAWIKKDFIKNVKDENYKITYKNKYNHLRTVKIKDFEKDPYVLGTIDKFETVLYKGIVTASIMLGIIIGGLLLFFLIKGKRIKLSNKIRGIFLNNDLKKQITKHNKKISSYKPFTFADFAYPITGRKNSWSSGEQSHTLVLGATGAGKTKIIQDLVYQLHKRSQKAIIIDTKGDYISHFYREKKGDIILNPFDKRGRNWSLFNETTPLKGFSTIAKSMLPRESKSDPIWVEAARVVFAEVASLYANENISLSEFADKILKTDFKKLAKILEKTSASKIINEEIEKASLSVLMVLATYLRPLRLYKSIEDCFSITKWVHDHTQNNFLFISSKADVKQDINPIITSQVDIAVTALCSLKEESNIPKVWFILDELPYFNQSIPSLSDGLAMSRSFGGCFILGTQDMSQLSKIYSNETAMSIANNCKTKVFMNVEGKEAAAWCSAALGDGEMEEWHEGLSYGAHEMRDGIQVNRNRILRPLTLASEMMMLKAGEGFIKFSGFEPSKFRFNDIYLKKIAPAFDENLELNEIFNNEWHEGQERRKKIENKNDETYLQEDQDMLNQSENGIDKKIKIEQETQETEVIEIIQNNKEEVTTGLKINTKEPIINLV